MMHLTPCVLSGTVTLCRVACDAIMLRGGWEMLGGRRKCGRRMGMEGWFNF